jgi:hypothetical protein
MHRSSATPSPLTGEGKGGGEGKDSAVYYLPLPFIPSHQGRGRKFEDGKYTIESILTDSKFCLGLGMLE